MPRSLSATAKAAIYAAQTEQVFLLLLEISHASLSPTLRFVDNLQDVVSGGNTYTAFPFQLSLPDDQDDQLARVTLSIDNVDRQIVQAIRSLTSPPTIALKIVLASSPNTVEAGPFDFTLRETEYDALVVSGTLAFEDFLNEPYPVGSFTPNFFPGLF